MVPCFSADGDRHTISSPKHPRIDDYMDGDNIMKRPWNDLPNELLAEIANELGIIDLLRFRGVCKDWNAASVKASAEIESSRGKHPWLLIYAQNSDESLLLSKSEKYTLNTPELNGAKCIASMGGWLLVLKNDSIFFFCPFSHTKIDLPKLPNTEFSNCLGVFLTPPTSQDCLVSVACQNEKSLSDIELYILRRGENEWNCESLKQSLSKKIVCAAGHEDKIMLFDDASHCLKFVPKKTKWKAYNIVLGSDDPSAKHLPLATSNRGLSDREIKAVKEAMEMKVDDVFIEICGTGFAAYERSDMMMFIKSVAIGNPGSETSRRLKGVWIQPRLFYLANAYTW